MVDQAMAWDYLGHGPAASDAYANAIAYADKAKQPAN